MPFTGSHVAAILPFTRSGLVPSALAIGSMVPDLPYFAPVGVAASDTHSLLGLPTADLALGLACFVVWHLLLTPAAVAIAPSGLRQRLPRAGTLRGHLGSARSAAVLVASLVVGGATHLSWDAFTHQYGWGTRHIAWLAAKHGPVAGFQCAQHASTVLGGAVLAVWAALWWRRTPPHEDAEAKASRVVRLAVVAGVLLGTATGGVLRALEPLLDPHGPYLRLAAFHAVTGAGLGGGLTAVLMAVVLRAQRLNADQRAARPAATDSRH